MADKRIVNGSRHDNSIDPFLLKEVDILALLLFVGYIENGIFMLFLILIQAVL